MCRTAGIAQLILTSAPDGVASFTLRSLYPGEKKALGTHPEASWVGPRACLDALQKTKLQCLYRESNLGMVSTIKISSLLGIESRPCSLRPLTLLTAPTQLHIGHHIHSMFQCQHTAYFVTPIRRNNNNLETQSCKKEDKN